jgi:hypothetical protein
MEQQKTTLPETAPERRSKRRVSVMDIVIILLVLVAVAGIVFRVVSVIREGAPTSKGARYAVEFSVAETPTDIFLGMQIGDGVFLYKSGAKLGYMGAYQQDDEQPYRVALTLTPGTAKGTSTAIGEFVCTDGEMTNGGLLVNAGGLYLTPGTELLICTERVLLTVTVTEIRPIP